MHGLLVAGFRPAEGPPRPALQVLLDTVRIDGGSAPTVGNQAGQADLEQDGDGRPVAVDSHDCVTFRPGRAHAFTRSDLGSYMGRSDTAARYLVPAMSTSHSPSSSQALSMG